MADSPSQEGELGDDEQQEEDIELRRSKQIAANKAKLKTLGLLPKKQGGKVNDGNNVASAAATQEPSRRSSRPHAAVATKRMKELNRQGSNTESHGSGDDSPSSGAASGAESDPEVVPAGLHDLTSSSEEETGAEDDVDASEDEDAPGLSPGSSKRTKAAASPAKRARGVKAGSAPAKRASAIAAGNGTPGSSRKAAGRGGSAAAEAQGGRKATGKAAGSAAGNGEGGGKAVSDDDILDDVVEGLKNGETHGSPSGGGRGKKKAPAKKRRTATCTEDAGGAALDGEARVKATRGSGGKKKAAATAPRPCRARQPLYKPAAAEAVTAADLEAMFVFFRPSDTEGYVTRDQIEEHASTMGLDYITGPFLDRMMRYAAELCAQHATKPPQQQRGEATAAPAAVAGSSSPAGSAASTAPAGQQDLGPLREDKLNLAQFTVICSTMFKILGAEGAGEAPAPPVAQGTWVRGSGADGQGGSLVNSRSPGRGREDTAPADVFDSIAAAAGGGVGPSAIPGRTADEVVDVDGEQQAGLSAALLLGLQP